MNAETIHKHREQIAYIRDVKSLILSDAKALYSTHGHTSHKTTFDVITSTQNGAWQATLIMYPDLTTDTSWQSLYDGMKCRDLGSAMKMLWDGVQTELGVVKAMQQAAAIANAAMYSTPVSMRQQSASVEPKTPCRESSASEKGVGAEGETPTMEGREA